LIVHIFTFIDIKYVSKTVTNRLELRRIVELNNKSKSVGVSIPSTWVDKLDLSKQECVKLQLEENGFRVEKINFD
jgi:hypothetical protein